MLRLAFLDIDATHVARYRGVVVALLTTRLLGNLLFHVVPRDPVVLAGVVGVMTFAAIVACVLPGWRAAHLDAIRALRA